MTPGEVRERAAGFRAEAAKASAEHATLARAMARVGAAERASLEIQAGVADCMARRYRQWASALDEAAHELEDP